MKIKRSATSDTSQEEQRLAAIRKLRGMFPDMISSEEFARRKAEEIEIEERHLKKKDR